MSSFVLGRKGYWIWVAVLLALKLAVVVALERVPALLWILSHVDTALMVVGALAVGARFADIGWSRWLGFSLVLTVVLVLPVLLALVFPLASGPVSSPLEGVSEYGWITAVALTLLLLLAGLPRGAASGPHAAGS